MALEVSTADLIVRVYGNAEEATTWLTMDELEEKIRLRLDYQLWAEAADATKVRTMIQAYNDLARLSWSTNTSRSRQDYDYESSVLFGAHDLGVDPPLHLEGFRRRIGEAQAAQVCYILSGTHIRELQRDGVRMTRQLQGSELDLAGYRGPVCIEALELLAPYVDLQPRVNRPFR